MILLHITLISQQALLLETLVPLLKTSGFQFSCVETLEELIANSSLVIYAPEHFSEVELDVLQKHDMFDETEWIIITDGKPNPYIDKLMTMGASYHFRTPLDIDHLNEVLQEFHKEFQQEEEQKSLAPVTSTLDQFGLLLGSSPVMRRLYRLIRRASKTDTNIMLVGESGTGKELAARTIHEQSLRAEHPFIAINSAALTPELVESELFGHLKGAFTGAVSDREGCFEQGNEGTLFLDEITEMPVDLQSKLLRVLESGEFKRVGSNQVKTTNVRIIAATNRQPISAIEDGFLREDIYFRLAHFPIQLPPLRKRGKDITELAQHFLAYRNSVTGTHKVLSDSAMQVLMEYTWPGNVRELKHCIEQAHILASDTIGPNELALLKPDNENTANIEDIRPGTPLKEAERILILATLDSCSGNKTQAADQLGISLKTLYNKLEQYSD
ncbi:sigma-54-dependent Fis family transcriptional regulator [Neptunomonas concharum]|uniref:Sigma-54-dependent Fis family transcriptional regulator n=1 Tax=Neptunomonas concharum TaxID=1031538 RepID=A0A5P1RCW8_9GAMM|nr:sigma-54-dependent Fis family transcriptional regulator [Neptunomonas concharum]